MNPRFACFAPTVALALLAAGCGDGGAVTTKRSPYYTDPNDYFGTYIGQRIDIKDSAMADSTEELIGSSTLIIDNGDVTYSLTHERIKFSGTYQYRVDTRLDKDGKKEKFRIMELYVYDVEEFQSAGSEGGDGDVAAGWERSAEELEELYEDIRHRIHWRFEILEDGFRQLDSDAGPGMYEFHREPS
ncbi:MAG: hypothetical protein IH945_13405 [Armatimonadetes bacterium]|nr:hypothetical protein [Armatimonadota bacterium]